MPRAEERRRWFQSTHLEAERRHGSGSGWQRERDEATSDGRHGQKRRHRSNRACVGVVPGRRKWVVGFPGLFSLHREMGSVEKNDDVGRSREWWIRGYHLTYQLRFNSRD